MKLDIRLATENDAEQIVAIYAPVVRHTAISFELEPPSVPEMQERIQTITHQYPWLVGEQAGTIWGYVYASAHRARPAYQWSVDTTVYIHQDYRGRGVGRALYTALLKILPRQGYYNAYAGIALPNAASVALHESVGFQPLGIYHHVGYKLGRWHDVGWWQMALQPLPVVPEAPRPLHILQATGELANILKVERPEGR